MKQIAKAIITTIINQLRKNGNDLLKPEQKDLLIRFRDFDITKDWMEGKDITKIEKLLFTHLRTVVGIGYKGLYGLTYYTEDKMTRWLKGWNWDHANKEERKEMKAMVETSRPIFPIVEKWSFMKENRAIQNGRLPKAAREEQERIEIKGALNPTLRTELERITEKFKNTMIAWYFDHYKGRRTKAIEFFKQPVISEPKDSNDRDAERKYSIYKRTVRHHDLMMKIMDKKRVPQTDKELKATAEFVAEQGSQSWFFKMADKLGGMVTSSNLKSVSEIMNSKSNPFQSEMRFNFKNGSGFSILNKVVLNYSPLGTPFNQFPCTFHDVVLADGSKVKSPNEHIVKKEFNNQAKI